MPEKGWSQWNELPVDDSFTYGERFGVSDEFDSQNMRFSIIRFHPGDRGPLHYHEEPGEEFYLVLEGELDITMGDEVVQADEGTVLYTPSETQHFPENNTDEPAVLLAASAPNIPPSEGITVIEDAPADD
jgi:mannose-6-phosphate isomerase-like protein (cupin superfamily)